MITEALVKINGAGPAYRLPGTAVCHAGETQGHGRTVPAPACSHGRGLGAGSAPLDWRIRPPRTYPESLVIQSCSQNQQLDAGTAGDRCTTSLRNGTERPIALANNMTEEHVMDKLFGLPSQATISAAGSHSSTCRQRQDSGAASAPRQ